MSSQKKIFFKDHFFFVNKRVYEPAEDTLLLAENMKVEWDDLVLDVGTGTGVVARHIKDHVKHVVAVDISYSMLEKGKWEDISIIKCDIGDSIFIEGLFDRIIARLSRLATLLQNAR